jgi:hypothetical protein
VLPAESIAHTSKRQETAALRDFDLAYDRCGSLADITPFLGDVRFATESGHQTQQ